MRINQWPKNSFIFAALVFDGQLFHPRPFLKTLLAFLILCVLNSGVYFYNDLIDIESDRNHPQKKSRPIASGQISQKTGWISAVVLVVLALFTSWFLSRNFWFVTLGILAVNIVYTRYLKHIPLVDVITIGVLFILRVVAGVMLITVKVFSPWLYLVTFMLALYLGFGKRRSELAHTGQQREQTRKALKGYSLELLDQLITIVSSVTIMAYSLYTFSGPTVPGNNLLMMTIPVVIYGIFRYHYLIQIEHAGGAPEEIFIHDRWMQVTILIYAVIVCCALYL